jgi:hypothetical protein
MCPKPDVSINGGPPCTDALACSGDFLLYLHGVVSSVTRPVKELKGFQRVTLTPGESTTVLPGVTSNPGRRHFLAFAGGVSFAIPPM